MQGLGGQRQNGKGADTSKQLQVGAEQPPERNTVRSTVTKDQKQLGTGNSGPAGAEMENKGKSLQNLKARVRDGCCHPEGPLCEQTLKYASSMPQNPGPRCFLIQSSKLMIRIHHRGLLTKTDIWTDSVSSQVTRSLRV